MALKSSKKKRICSLLLTGLMLVSMVPTSVFSEETITEPETVAETVAEIPATDEITGATEVAATSETEAPALDEISGATEGFSGNEEEILSQETDTEILAGGGTEEPETDITFDGSENSISVINESGEDQSPFDEIESVILTLILPDGFTAEDVLEKDDGTLYVERTVDESGNITPINIKPVDELDAGTFNAEIATLLNQTSQFDENNLTATYDEATDTLIITGFPAQSVELDMNAILMAVMEESDEYQTIYTQDATLDPITMEDGSKLTVATGATLTLTGCVTINGAVTISGGGTIKRGSDFGYFSLSAGSSLTVDGVTIDGGNIEATYSMFNVLSNTAQLNLKNSTVQNCKKYSGGAAIVIANGSILTITDTTIQNCCATNGDGGAISAGGATVNIVSGTFSKNTATGYGGFINLYEGTLTISDGNFINNTANRGGVLFMSANNQTYAHVNGGTFADNTATGSGYEGSGAIYAADCTTYNESNQNMLYTNGSAYFTNNSNGEDGIYFADRRGEITITSALQNPIYMYRSYLEIGRVVAQGSGYALTTNDAEKIICRSGNISDTQAYDIKLSTTDNVAYSTKPQHIHCICGGSNSSGDHTSHTDVTWTAWDGQYAENIFANTENNVAYLYLTGEAENFTVKSGTTIYLCLNGYNVSSWEKGDTITVEKGGALIITDCHTGDSVGKITHKDGYAGCGINNQGTFTLWNGSISGNTVDGNGGGVNNSWGTFYMYGGSVADNVANISGGVNNYGGTFIMYDGSITHNKAKYFGGGVKNQGAFTMYNGSITKNSASSGGGVRNNSGDSFVMYGGNITENTAETGGGVSNRGGTFVMSGGSITSNNATSSGGGVYDETAFKMSGKVLISGNKVNGTFAEDGTLSGGTDNNIFICNSKFIESTGLDSGASVGITAENPDGNPTVVTGTTSSTGFFSDNSDYDLQSNGENGLKLGQHKHCICGKSSCDDTSHGDSVPWTAWTDTDSLPTEGGNYFLKDNVTLSDTWTVSNAVHICLNGKTITGTDNGDVITVNTGAKLTITDCQNNAGTITKNNAYNYCVIENKGTFVLWKGTICKGNRGVNNEVGSIFTMYGGDICDNGSQGVYNCGTFAMKGGTIRNNTYFNGTGVYNSGGAFAMSGGSITGNTCGVTTNTSVTLSGSITITDNVDDNGVTNNLQLDRLGGNVLINAENLSNGSRVGINVWSTSTSQAPVTVVSGSSSIDIFFSDLENYKLTAGDTGNTLILSVKEHQHCVCGKTDCSGDGHESSDKWMAWASYNSLPKDNGNYYLTADVNLSGTWEVNSDIKICLNGKSITTTSDGDVIKVNSGASLTLTDCTTESTAMGNITHSEGKSGRGISNSGTLTFWNGFISGNTIGDASGGGVCNNQGATFKMYGGIISGNHVTFNNGGRGGGVFNEGAFEMNGGTIAANEALHSGGGVSNEMSGTFTMTEGTIEQNSAGKGGGVRNLSNFDMSGGDIIDNSAQSDGGGIYNMSSSLTIAGGNITGNKANNGGGVHTSCSLKLSGTVVISSNTCNEIVNNVYLENSNSFIKVEDSIGENARIGITVANPGNGSTVVTGSVNTDIFTSDNTDYELVQSGSNDLKLADIKVEITGVTLNNKSGGTITDGESITEGTMSYCGMAVICDKSHATYTPATVSGVTLTYTWQKLENGTYCDIDAAPADAGSYRLHVTATKNNKVLGTKDLYVTINPRIVTVDVKVADKDYDGNTTATISESKLDDLLTKDEAKVTLDATQVTAAFNDENVGTDKSVSLTGAYTLSGDSTVIGNYVLEQPTDLKASINQKKLTITGATVTSKPYDGKKGATITEVSFSGLAENEKLILDTDYKVSGAAYDGVNATGDGAASKVTFTVTLKDTATTKNYKLGDEGKSATGEQSATIDKAAHAACSAETKGKRGAQNTCEIPASYIVEGGKVNNIQITADTSGILDGTPSYTEGTSSGTNGTLTYKLKDSASEDKTATVTMTVTSDNYNDYTIAVTVGVTAKEQVTITFGQAAGYSYEYNGDTQAPQDNDITVSENKVPVNTLVKKYQGVDGTTYESTEAPTNAGKYTMAVSVLDSNLEYVGSGSCSFEIKQKLLTATITADDKTYDGSNSATVQTSLSGVVNSDKVTVAASNATFADANAGTNKTVTATIALSGDGAANYTVNGTATTTANINQKEVTITGIKVEETKTYDGTTDATVIATDAAIKDKVTTDDLTIKVGTAQYDTKTVGTDKAVTFTGFALTGESKDNYILTAQPTSTKASITEKNLTITNLAVEDKDYDGTNTATIKGTPTLDGVITDDKVELENGTPTFTSTEVGTGIAINFTEFTLQGNDSTNYTLTQPTGIKANINAYIATKGEEYSVNSNDWLKGDFIVTPKDGWKLSYTKDVDGDWVAEITASEETDNGTLEFYLKNTETGTISEKVTEHYKVDKTAPVISAAENGKIFCAAVTLTITDKNLDKVTSNGEEVTLTADTLTINPAEGEQTVVAADKAGNTTSLTITVNDGHTWGDWTSNEDDTHTRTCTVEGCNKSETEHCSGGKADCHTKAVCDLCGDSYGEFDAANHTGGTEVRDQKAATCTTKGYTGDTYCKGCGVKLTSGKEIPVAGHTWSKWTTKTKATVFKAEVQQRSCSVCKETETKTVGKKLTPTITVNARKIWLQKGQKTSAFKVTGLANGDSVKSYKSSNTKIFTVTNKGVIKAGKKVGKAKLIITLKSGLKKVIPIKVQNRRVRTWHIYNLPTKVTLKKGATYNLKPVISLITSTHGFTYGSSNKKVATVNKNGMITAKKKGTATITVKSRKITEKVKITVK